MLKAFNDINFITSEWDDYEEEESKKNYEYSYLEIGLNVNSQYIRDEQKYSLIENFIDKNYINNQNWFIYFFNKTEEKNNDNDDGIIVFGNDPVVFFGNKYSKDNIPSCQGVNNDYDYKSVVGGISTILYSIIAGAYILYMSLYLIVLDC